MDVRCERCKTEYEFDDARITEAGVTVKCTSCGHVFRVRKKTPQVSHSNGHDPEAPSNGAYGSQSAAPGPGDKREWKVRQANGNVITFRQLTNLQRWIVERKVGREDEISLTGETWKRLGEIAELGVFFRVVDEAQKAKQLEMQQPNGATAPASASPAHPVAPPTFVPFPSAPASREPPAPPAATRTPQSLLSPSPIESSPPPPAPVAPLQLTAAMEAPLAAPAAAEPDATFNQSPPPQPETASAPEPETTDSESPPPTGWRAAIRERTEKFYIAARGLRNLGKGAKWAVGLIAAVVLGGAGLFGYSASSKSAPPQTAEAAQPVATPDPVAPPSGIDSEASGAGPSTEREAPSGLVAESAAAAPTLDAKPEMSNAPAAGAIAPTTPPGALAAKAAERPPRGAAKDFDWYMSQGDKLRDREKIKAALEAYRAAAELAPNRAEPVAGKGFALLDLGQKPQAEAAFREALRLNPRYAVAVIGLAETYRQMGKNAQAIEQYERYLEILPEGSEAPVAKAAIERLKE
jgi:predicted Zn finger-like uncharacterized protein